MIDRIKQYIKDNGLFNKGAGIVIALSGGADSVCLFRVLVSLREEYNLKLYSVHVNHGIRGEEAARDEKFAVSLAEKYNVPCRVFYYDVPSLAADWKMTEEEAGRKVRYDSFRIECNDKDADCVAVAHHMNDQVETVLFRMCRGTGIKGMCGIPSKRDNIIRPLLCVCRKQIEQYLDDIKQEYVTDSTNEVTEYDRNRIRHEIIPKMCEINRQAVEHVCEISVQTDMMYCWFEECCEKIYKECVFGERDCFYLRKEVLKEQPEIVKSEIIRKVILRLVTTLKDIERRHISAIIEISEAESGKRINLPYSIIAENQYEYIRIYEDGSDYTRYDGEEIDIDMSSSVNSHTFYNVYLPEGKKLVNELCITYKLKNCNEGEKNIPKNSCIKWIDYDKINGMLKIRQSRADDYFLIDNVHKKKMSRYFIDEKIPRQYRDNLIVVAQGNNVLYVVGGKQGKGCYVDENTTRFLELEYL